MPFTYSASSREDPDPGGLISAGPPPATEDTTTSEPKPLGGLPRDYRVAPGPGSRGYYPSGFNYTTRTYGEGAPGGIGPRYVDGDEWRPASIGAAGIKSLQRAMATAGILTGDFRWGRWTKETADAYAEVLGYANARGITDQMALAELVDSPMINVGGSGGQRNGGGGRSIIGFDENGEPIYGGYVPPPLEIKTTNPDDLRSIMRRAVIDIKGEGWNQDQINELVDAYNWQEIRVQKQAYDQKVALERAAFESGDQAISGAVVSQPTVPSPETFVESELMRRDPIGTQAGKVVNQAIPQFLQIVGGWGNR